MCDAGTRQGKQRTGFEPVNKFPIYECVIFSLIINYSLVVVVAFIFVCRLYIATHSVVVVRHFD